MLWHFTLGCNSCKHVCSAAALSCIAAAASLLRPAMCLRPSLTGVTMLQSCRCNPLTAAAFNRGFLTDQSFLQGEGTGLVSNALVQTAHCQCAWSEHVSACNCVHNHVRNSQCIIRCCKAGSVLSRLCHVAVLSASLRCEAISCAVAESMCCAACTVCYAAAIACGDVGERLCC